MTTSQYLLGAAELAVIAAALGLGAYHVRAVLVPGWSGAPARLAEVVLGISALVVIAELLGVLGLLKEGWLVAGSVAIGLAGAQWARRRAPAAEAELPSRPSAPMLVVAAAAAALVVAHWAVPTQESLDTGMYYQDTTWYHMSFSARFAQEAEVGPLHFTDPLKLTAWFYPQNSALLHAVGIVALDNDFLSPLINLGWLLLALLAAWCIGRPYAVGAATLLGAAVVLDSDMIVGSQAGNAPDDIASLFFLLATIAILITGETQRHGVGPGPVAAGARVPVRGDTEGLPSEARLAPNGTRATAAIPTGALFLAGLAAGLGIGTKITLLAALGVLTLGILVLAGPGRRVRAGAIWLAGMLVTSGFWYGRNLVHAVNPLPQIDELGPIDLPGPDQVPELYPREPHELAEYANDPGVWVDSFFPILDDRLGPLWFVALGAVVIGLVLALFAGGSRLMRVLAVTGIVAGFAYVFTPLTASGSLGNPTGFDANLRYVSPPVIMGLVLLPLVPVLRRGRWPWIVTGLFAVLLLQGTIDSGAWDLGHIWGALILAALLVGVPVALTVLAREGMRPPAMGIAALATFAVLVALGRPEQEDYLRDRYQTALSPPLEGGFRSTPEWKPLQQWGKEASDERVAVVGRAGAFGQYVFYGDDLSNHVQYIGRELRRGTFRQVDACADWREKINEGDYDYVVTTPRLGQSEEKEPKENLWTGKDPAARVVVRSGPARVYEIRGELDPSTCRRLGEDARA